MSSTLELMFIFIINDSTNMFYVQPKDIQFVIIEDVWNQQMFPFGTRIEGVTIIFGIVRWFQRLSSYQNGCRVISCISTNQLID